MRVGLGGEAHNWLEHAEIIHHLDQGDEGDQRHQMRDHDVSDPLPPVGTVDHRGFQRVLIHGL